MKGEVPGQVDVRQTLYFDDLHVGQRFVSRALLLDEMAMIDFARQFDPQPFHIDREAAVGSFFGGLAASGWHTAALTMRLLVESVPLAGGLIGAGGEVTWPRPTRAGDELRVVSVVEEIAPSRSRPERGTIRLRSETRTRSYEVAQVLIARLIVPRRSSPG